MKKPTKNKRFATKSINSSFFTSTTVIVDKETGVNYLFVQSGYSGGLTPLLNRDGTPVVTTVFEEEN